MSTLQPIIVTRDLERLLRFYAGLFDAQEIGRHPEDGPLFYIQLRVGDSELGLVADDDAPVDAPQRTALSVEVADVDAVLPRVAELGGRVQGPPNDMPWGQRVAHVEDVDGNAVNLMQRL